MVSHVFSKDTNLEVTDNLQDCCSVFWMWNIPQSSGHDMVDIHTHKKVVHVSSESDGWKLERTFSSYLPGTYLGICASHLTTAFGSLGLKILFL